MAFRKHFQRIQRVYARGGWREVGLRAFRHRAVQKYLFSYQRFGIYQLDGSLKINRRSGGFRLEKGGLHDVPEMAKITEPDVRQSDRLRAVFYRFIRQGGECIVARDKGEMVGY